MKVHLPTLKLLNKTKTKKKKEQIAGPEPSSRGWWYFTFLKFQIHLGDDIPEEIHSFFCI